LTLFAPPHRPQGGAGNLKFTIYAPLVPKIHYTKFEKNWSNGYQGEVKNVNRHYISCLPSPGGKTATPRIINFTVLVEAFLLYITMYSAFPPHVRISTNKVSSVVLRPKKVGNPLE
jgi:hypothetical protein